MKKGFTLIELLAVIVVLAVIALIAVPRIMDAIDDSRKEAFENNKYMMVKATENYLINNQEEIPAENTASIIDLEVLVDEEFIRFSDFDPEDDSCSGYIIAKNDNGIVSYHPYLKCSGNESDGFLERENLIYHFDASLVVGYEDGEQMDYWIDVSGNNNNAYQEDENRKPFLSEYNGLPMVEFRGGQSFLIPHDRMGSRVEDNTVFLVTKANQTSSRNRILAFSSGGSSRLTMFVESGSFNYASGAFTPRASGTASTNLTLLVGTKSSDDLEFYINENLVGTATLSNASGPDAASIGSWQGTTQYFNGYIAELIIYNRALSASEIEYITNYLNEKWNI